jgi:tetratricopeptide (TPR) repeat protein
MTIRKYIIILALILRELVIFAQNSSSESVRALLTQTQQLIREEKLTDANVLALKALNLAKATDFGWGMGEAQRLVGQIYRNTDKIDSAIAYFKLSAETFDTYNLSERQARALALQAHLIQSKRLYEEAAALHFKILKIYNEKLSPEEAAKNLDIKGTALERMAALLSNQKQYKEAETYALEAYQLFEKFKDKGLLEICCTTVGNVYYWKKQYETAAFYYQKAVDICVETGRKLGRTLNNLAMVQNKAKLFDEAVSNYLKAIKDYNVNPGFQERILIAQTYSNIGGVYHDKGDLNLAEIFLLRGIDSLKVLNSTVGLSEAYDELVLVLTKKGNFAVALDYQKRYGVLQDSMFYKRRQTELLELQTKFDNEKKTKEIQLLNQDKTVRDLQLQRQTLDLINQRLFTEKNQQTLEVLRQAQALQEAELARTQAAFDVEKQEKLAQSAVLTNSTNGCQRSASKNMDFRRFINWHHCFRCGFVANVNPSPKSSHRPSTG